MDDRRRADLPGGRPQRHRCGRLPEGEPVDPAVEYDPDAEIRTHAVYATFVGSYAQTTLGQNQIPGNYNWLVGQDETAWVRGAREYAGVLYRDLYPQIDLQLLSIEPTVKDPSLDDVVMKTTYVVRAHGDPSEIAIRYEGADSIEVDGHGNLVIRTPLGNITELRPVAHQSSDLGERPVAVWYEVNGTTVTFGLGSYDTKQALYIDPVAIFSRTFGGSSTESLASMNEDATGRYITGGTYSTNFPATPGSYDTTIGSSLYDWYAAKFDLANENLLWATYIGGRATTSSAASRCC